jgi:hypothetical protein
MIRDTLRSVSRPVPIRWPLSIGRKTGAPDCRLAEMVNRYICEADKWTKNGLKGVGF